MALSRAEGAFLLCLLSLSVVSATTWYISPFGSNSNSGTSPASPFLDLKTAINAASAGDTISCAAGAYTGSNNVGLTITDLNIVGSAASPTTFESSSGYIFYLQGDSTLSTLTLDGSAGGVSVEGDNGSKMTLKNIDFIAGGNGIIFNQTNTLVVDNCYFSADINYGIYGTFSSVATNYVDTLTVNNCDFQCSLDAIYISSSSTTTTSVKKLVVSDTSVATASNGVYISVSKGPDTLSFTNCSFIGMNSDTNGGALYVKAKSLVIDACLFDGNSADDFGAAIYFYGLSDGSNLSVSGSAFYESSLFSDTGMGAHIYTSTAQTVTVTNTYFSGGNYADDGGAVYIENAATADFSYCLFYDNFAWDEGGALKLYEVGTATISSSAFIDNYTFYKGGALYLSNSTTTVSSTFVYSNSADYGGGAYLYGDATTTMNSVAVVQGTALYGAGVYAAAPFRSFFGVFDTNAANDDYYGSGGALYVTENTSLLFNLVKNNTAEADGGGICVISTGTLNARLLMVEGNDGGTGGGVACIGGTMNFFVANFTDNTASYGSAYYCESSCSATGNYIYVDSSNSVYGCSSNVETDEMWQGTEADVVELNNPSHWERLNDHVRISEEVLDMMMNHKEEFYAMVKELAPQEVVSTLLI